MTNRVGFVTFLGKLACSDRRPSAEVWVKLGALEFFKLAIVDENFLLSCDVGFPDSFELCLCLSTVINALIF